MKVCFTFVEIQPFLLDTRAIIYLVITVFKPHHTHKQHGIYFSSVSVACFNPLYKPLCGVVHFTKWGAYRNLAQNASTSDVARPPSVLFGHYDRTRIKKGGGLSKTSFPLSVCTGVCGLTLTLPNVDVCLKLWLEMQELLAAPGVCFWSKGIVRGNDMGWSGFLFWHLLKCCSVRHGFMSF